MQHSECGYCNHKWVTWLKKNGYFPIQRPSSPVSIYVVFGSGEGDASLCPKEIKYYFRIKFKIANLSSLLRDAATIEGSRQ